MEEDVEEGIKDSVDKIKIIESVLDVDLSFTVKEVGDDEEDLGLVLVKERGWRGFLLCCSS